VKTLTSLLRVLAGLVCVGTLVVLATPLLLLLLPWRVRRIHVTNALGSVVGRVAMFFSGCQVKVEGLENVRADRPAIYIANHTSVFDAFTTIWLTPKGTVGVAKKELFFYPFYGQAWWLAGHVFIDRARSERAKATMRMTADFIRDNRLSLCILPEGTRSTRGLLPFKKGVAHLALATRLPIVPMVHVGLEKTWKKGSLALEPADVTITFLPAIPTDSWTEARIDEHLAEIREPFLAYVSAADDPSGS
jgi:1-acyl-sn-glycerol-3-phosphate acyltransferase